METRMMEKELGQVKITETDNGFRVDVTGKSLKELCSCGCLQIVGRSQGKNSDCCPPEKDKE